MSRPSKMRNQPTEIDGIRFASKKEARRYQELRMLERSEAIAGLVVHPAFPIVINQEKICTVIPDFTYLDLERDRQVVEDVKGAKKGAAYAMFRLKAKLFHAIYALEITEV